MDGRLTQTYNKTVNIGDHRKRRVVEIFFFFNEQIQNWFSNKNRKKKQDTIMKGSNPKAVLCYKQNTNQSAVLLRQKSEGCWNLREGLSFTQGTRAIGLCVGRRAEFSAGCGHHSSQRTWRHGLVQRTVQTKTVKSSWEDKIRWGLITIRWSNMNAAERNWDVWAHRQTEASVLYKTWRYGTNMF